jgi:hypothetical protein
VIIPSPKLGDLKRDGSFALHSYPCPDNEDAFFATGRAQIHKTVALRRAAIHAFLSQPGRKGPPLDESDFADQTLVEFYLDSCLLTRTTGHGDPSPQHTIWKRAAS